MPKNYLLKRLTPAYLSLPSLPGLPTAKPTTQRPVARDKVDSGSDDEFTLLEGENIEDDFEIYNPPPEDVDDFALIQDAKYLQASPARTLERVLPSPVVSGVDGTVGSLKQIAGVVATTPGLLSKAVKAGGSAVSADFLSREAHLTSTWTPTTYVGPFLAASLATILSTGAKAVRGIEDINHELTITNAEDWLKRNSAGLSKSQKDTGRAWIEEAKKRLKDFTSKNFRSLNDAINAGPEAKEEVADAGGSKKKRQEQPSRPSVPKATIGSILKGADDVSASMNPEKDLLETKEKDLAGLLQALEAMVKIPCAIQKTTREEYDANFKNNRAMCSREFKDSLESRGAILAGDAWNAPNSQTKRILVAASGPGTGKTTSIETMCKWANLPVVKLSGEAFNLMEIPKGRDAFDVLEDWMKSCLIEKFDGNINGMFLFDDFHKSWENNGHFADDPESLDKFFDMLKPIADAAQEDVVSKIELAPGRMFPLNFVRVNATLTLNRLHPKLAEKGDEALRSRCLFLNVAYPTDLDRSEIADEHSGENLRVAIKNHYGWNSQELAENIDLNVLRESLAAIVQFDSKKAKTFNGELGVRAFADLLKRFEVHVLAKMGAPDAPVDRNLFSFAGKTEFSPQKLAGEIEDYNKSNNEELSRRHQQKATDKAISDIKAATETLPPDQLAAIEAMLKDVARLMGQTQARTIASIQKRLEHYTDRKDLPDAEVFGKAMRRKFGHTQSSGASGEADLFNSIKSVLTQLYFRRAAAKSENYRDNKIVRVKFTDPSAKDPSIYGDIASLLGGLPIHFLLNSDSIFTSKTEHPTIKSKDPEYAKLRGNLMEHEFRVSLDFDQFYGQWRETKVDGYSYFYVMALPRGAGGSAESSYLVLDAQGVKNMGSEHPRSVDAHSPGVTHIQGKGSIEKLLKQRLAPKINLFEDFISKAENGTSFAETLLVGIMTSEVREAMSEWRAAQNDVKPDKSARDVFEAYLHEQLNSAEIKLKDGSTFDPRSLTVFLLDEPTDYVDPPSKDDDIVTTMTIGIPPLEGRKQRAEYTLNQALAKVMVEANKNRKLVNRPLLTQLSLDKREDHAVEDRDKHKFYEQDAFNALIAFDLDIAKRARAVEVALPTTYLEIAVRDLAKRVDDRSTNYFGLEDEQSLPGIKSFETEWSSTYKPHLMIIENAEHAKAFEAKRAAEAEQRATQLKADVEKTRRMLAKKPASVIARPMPRTLPPPPLPASIAEDEAYQDPEGYAAQQANEEDWDTAAGPEEEDALVSSIQLEPDTLQDSSAAEKTA